MKLPILTIKKHFAMQKILKQDIRALQVRYKLGFISKRDYESAKIQLEQANLTIYTSKYAKLLSERNKLELVK